MIVLATIIIGTLLSAKRSEKVMNLSTRVKNIAWSSTLKVADHVAELERGGAKILNLSTGAPHIPTPEAIKQHTIQAIIENKTGYSHSSGIYELRKALCEHLNAKFSTSLEPERNILITPGGKQAILYFMLSVIEPGDEVLIPEPAWVSFVEIVRLAGGVAVPVPTSPDDGFTLSLAALESAITPKTKALIINNPCNPTGKLIDADTLYAIKQICATKKIFLFADEIYDQIVFKGYEHTSMLSINPDLDYMAVMNGFSKTYAMTGWRLAYIVAAPPLIDAMLKLQQNSITCPTTFVQWGVVKAFDQIHSFPHYALSLYQHNRDYLIKEFASLKNFRLIEPEGAFYGFIDVSRINPDSTAFCLDLLNRCNVAATPGGAFGKSGEGFIRISFAVDYEKLVEFVTRLKQEFE